MFYVGRRLSVPVKLIAYKGRRPLATRWLRVRAIIAEFNMMGLRADSARRGYQYALSR